VVLDVTRSRHCGGDVDNDRHDSAIDNGGKPIRIIDAVLKAQQNGVGFEVGCDLPSSLLGIAGFHAEEDDVGIGDAIRIGRGSDGHRVGFLANLQEQASLGNGVDVVLAADQRDLFARASQ
jgi:hypothetical protein